MVRDHASQGLEEWRPGVMTRMLVSAETGARALCVFEQFVEPGCGAPTHRHEVEEVLTVLSGEAAIWCGDRREAVRPGQSVTVPAGTWHGFTNTGAGMLHMHAILAGPVFEAWNEGASAPRRRWEPSGR